MTSPTPAPAARSTRSRPTIAARPALVGAVNTTSLIVADAIALGGPVAWAVAGVAVAAGGSVVARKVGSARRSTVTRRARQSARRRVAAPTGGGVLGRLRAATAGGSVRTGAIPSAAGSRSGTTTPPDRPGRIARAGTRIAATPTGRKLAAADTKVRAAAAKAKARAKRRADAAKAAKTMVINDPGHAPKKAKKAKKAGKKAAPTKKAGGVATKVPPAAGTTKATKKALTAAAKPNPAPAVPPPGASAPKPVPTGATTVAATMRRLLDLAEQMQQIAVGYGPDGMLEVIDDYDGLPGVLDAVAKAIGIFHGKAEESYPFKPVIIELIAATHRHQIATARAADEITPTARALHRQEIEDLEDAKKAMWDHARNKG